MGRFEFLKPGHHPIDDGLVTDERYAVDDHLYHLGANLVWALRHYTDFKQARESDPQQADGELSQLEMALEQAFKHFERMEELLRHGYSVSPESLRG